MGGVLILAYERRQQILEFMRHSHPTVTVEQLCRTLYASGATIRRDLAALEADQLIRRVRGGAVLVEGGASEDPLILRENQNSLSKDTIARLALPYIQEGMTLFLDSSSTVFALARLLDRFAGLQVITNGLKTALLLSDYKNITLRCTGGTLREHSKSLVGHTAWEYASRFHADLAVLSCRGLSLSRGATEANEDEYTIKKQFLTCSSHSLLLCDTSKLEVDFLLQLAPLSAFDRVLTEQDEATRLYSPAPQPNREE